MSAEKKRQWLPYRAEPRGRNWAVMRYRMMEEGSETVEKVATYTWEKPAKDEAYRLNGEWLKTGLPF